MNLIKTDIQYRALEFAGQSRHEEAGFTLVEASIALVVMMIVGLGAASLFVYAVGSNSSARDRELSMAVAQQQMEFLRRAPFANVESSVTSSGGANKQVTSAGRQYAVVTIVAATASQKTITVTVTGRHGHKRSQCDSANIWDGHISNAAGDRLVGPELPQLNGVINRSFQEGTRTRV